MIHTEKIQSDQHIYTISLGGTLDGTNTLDPIGYSPFTKGFEPNVSVRMENTGTKTVENPWITINGKRNWRSLRHILESILEAGMSEEEKARAIWEFARNHRYHFTSADDEVKDTVKMLNCYGYTLCWDEAYTVSNLWQAAGLKIRRGYPHGHCTTEVFYDGDYHLLDSDEHLLVLERDNKTIAGEAALSRDHDLLKRSHAYGILQQENRESSEGGASLFFYTGPRSGGRPLISGHEMKLDLRPGEALIWEWENRGKFHGVWDCPVNLCNGRLQFRPDLSPEGLAGSAVTAEGIHESRSETGAPMVRPKGSPAPASVVFRTTSPYVIVGGAVTIDYTKFGNDDRAALALRKGDGEWQQIWTAEISGETKASVPLDPFFPPGSPACYAYDIRIELQAHAHEEDVALNNLLIESDLQMAPLSLPALEIGENEITYTADAEGALEITHTWTEQESDPPPEPCETPEYPGDGQTAPGTQITFAWEPSLGARDYRIQVSSRADMKYTLSPVFDKLISKTPSHGKPEWRIPCEGLLNSDTTYYWRIRPRGTGGLWGEWSPTWSFTPRAPGIPLEVDTQVDWEQRAVTLTWSTNPEGEAVDHYEIYGSDERGFSASAEPYEVVTGKGKEPDIFPSNLIGKTANTSALVAGAGSEVDPPDKAFFRVIAVDANGARSGSSDFAETPRPFITTRPDSAAIAGDTYRYQMNAIRSIGELQSESNGQKRYISAFRDADTLRFLLDEAPAWIRLDDQTGLLTASPRAKDVGTHTVTLRVQNGNAGTDMQGFDLEVEPSSA
jgi:hypothetical protein